MVYEEQKLLTVLDAESLRSGSVSDRISECPLQGCGLPATGSLTRGRADDLSGGSFIKRLIPFVRAPPS